ncbi:MAG: hypothetical protein U0235_00265 [Polyangiaceae bacterium]
MIGDTVAEAAETLTVGSRNPVNAAIQTGTAITIQNDDETCPSSTSTISRSSRVTRGRRR